MPGQVKKLAIPKFPLRLMPSVRRSAERFSEKEGVSLNQFINLAVAEKLAHLEHDEWTHRRPILKADSVVIALSVLDRNGNDPAPEDELPTDYAPIRDEHTEVRSA